MSWLTLQLIVAHINDFHTVSLIKCNSFIQNKTGSLWWSSLSASHLTGLTYDKGAEGPYPCICLWGRLYVRLIFKSQYQVRSWPSPVKWDSALIKECYTSVNLFRAWIGQKVKMWTNSHCLTWDTLSHPSTLVLSDPELSVSDWHPRLLKSANLILN